MPLSEKPTEILIACEYNLYRSPAIAYLLNAHLRRDGQGDKFRVRSAGVFATSQPSVDRPIMGEILEYSGNERSRYNFATYYPDLAKINSLEEALEYNPEVIFAVSENLCKEIPLKLKEINGRRVERQKESLGLGHSQILGIPKITYESSLVNEDDRLRLLESPVLVKKLHALLETRKKRRARDLSDEDKLALIDFMEVEDPKHYIVTEDKMGILGKVAPRVVASRINKVHWLDEEGVREVYQYLAKVYDLHAQVLESKLLGMYGLRKDQSRLFKIETK